MIKLPILTVNGCSQNTIDYKLYIKLKQFALNQSMVRYFRKKNLRRLYLKSINKSSQLVFGTTKNHYEKHYKQFTHYTTEPLVISENYYSYNNNLLCILPIVDNGVMIGNLIAIEPCPRIPPPALKCGFYRMCITLLREIYNYLDIE